MAVREIRVSDFSGKEIDQEKMARVVVSGHPSLGSRTVELDAEVSEVEGLESSRVQLVSLAISTPGQAGVRRVVMEVAAFDRLFGEQDVADVLGSARRNYGSPSTEGSSRRGRQRSSGSRERVDYTGENHFGVLHRGRVTEEEAKLVRSNLDQANRNRAAAGQPPIDPEGDRDRKRYGF